MMEDSKGDRRDRRVRRRLPTANLLARSVQRFLRLHRVAHIVRLLCTGQSFADPTHGDSQGDGCGFPRRFARCSWPACSPIAGTPMDGAHGLNLGQGKVGQISSTAVSTSTTQAAVELTSQVVSGWFAAESAFANAAHTSDPNTPELTATTIDPQLTWSRSLLERMEAAGQIARGPVDYGSPHVIAFHGGLATVRTCAWDAEIVISAGSGQAAPGIPGQVDFDLFTSTMKLTEGGWKLLSQVIGVGQCDRR